MNASDYQHEIRITVKVFGGLRESFQGGERSFQLPSETTLDELLGVLDVKVSDVSSKLKAGIAAGYLNILVNGRNVRFLQGNATQLQDGDTVAFLPPVGGG